MKVSIGSKIVRGPWGGGNLFAINFDCVPLPAPGGPKITKFIYNTTYRTLFSL